MGQARAKQTDIFGQTDETSAYLSTDRTGFFSLLVNHGTRKLQSSHRLSEMPTVLRLVDTKRDSWLTQAEFIRPNRRVVNLARLGLLFSDLDTYNMPWAYGKTPDELATAVLYFCQQDGIPAPSMLIYSGRGLQAKWLLDTPLPRQALPRWNACQKQLVSSLASLGADPAARDASRVLRLVDTVNTKSGSICRVVHVTAGADGLPARYGFEFLAEILLPRARWDLEEQRRQREERKAALVVVPGLKKGHKRTFSGRQLAWDRLEDLRKLSVLRGGVSEGQRMVSLFWHINFLLLSGATNSALMFHEAAALAKEIDPKWNYRTSELGTLYSKAKAHEAGEAVEFNGRRMSALYTPKNATLISTFKITSEEQRQLGTIISTGEAAERHKDREEARRRAAGAVERAEYLKASNDKRSQAIALRQSGLKLSQIAIQLGVTTRSVTGYLKQ